MNTSEELKFVKEIAEATGVILDPVYRYDLVDCVNLYVFGDSVSPIQLSWMSSWFMVPSKVVPPTPRW